MDSSFNGPNKLSALYARIEGSINPSQVDLLENALATCSDQGHTLLVLGLDTPGGLGKSMRDMVKIMLNSDIPILVWVGPQGARAASAGVFLVAASTIASMAPQTNIGSASPVSLGGKDVPETMAKKIQNDFLSLIRGMAKRHGRNVDWYEQAVKEAESITATEAVMMRVVDYVATSPEDLLAQTGAQGIQLQDRFLQFSPEQIRLIPFDPGFRHAFLSWLLNPQIAYFLLMGGIAGLFFELSNPGSVFPGVFGGICLLLGLYAMSILPTNVAGLLLILLSVILFILEIAITSFGLLSVGAVICLLFGSIILFDFEYGFVELPMNIIISTVVGVTALIACALYLVTKAQLRPKKTGGEGMIGLTGVVSSGDHDPVQIRIRGELWRARSHTNQPLLPGTRVRVVDRDGLYLIVEPVNNGF
jgi:membrane-bound serine protease (ClpP class)